MKVYLIGNTYNGYCKIGKSEMPELRLSALDTPKLPFSVWLLAEFDAQGEAHRVEKELHKHFSHNKARGEWFMFIEPEDFLKVAEQFTGTNPRPGRTQFPLARPGSIGFEKLLEENTKRDETFLASLSPKQREAEINKRARDAAAFTACFKAEREEQRRANKAVKHPA